MSGSNHQIEFEKNTKIELQADVIVYQKDIEKGYFSLGLCDDGKILLAVWKIDADVDAGLMKVRNLTVPKLEFVLRYFTAGSMCRRFDLEEGIVFEPPYTEVTLKSDEQGDPLITDRLCIMKGMLKEGQFDQALDILVKVGEVLKKELAGMNLQLIDFKIEVGYDENGKIYVADEITPDIWRVRDTNGNIPNQIDCAKIILEKING